MSEMTKERLAEIKAMSVADGSVVKVDLCTALEEAWERLEAAEEEVDAFQSSEAYRRLERRIDRAEAALERINQWSQAYPLDVFPEPDYKRAHEVLKAHGMTIDSIGASMARHVVEGVGDIARASLPEEKHDD